MTSLVCIFSLLAVAASPLAPHPQPNPSLQDALNSADTLPVRAAPALPNSNIGLFHLGLMPEEGAVTLGHAPAATKRLVVDGHDVRFAPDGSFVIGFDRDFGPSTLITAFLADGRNISERLPVKKHNWAISTLPAATQHPTSDSDFQARRPDELAQINAARHVSSDSSGWRQHFIWPARARISDVFGSQRVYGTVPAAPHGGVDLAVPQGTPLLAPADGVVILAADHPFTLEGNLLMVDHGLGLNSAFLHLSKIVVKLGDHIKQGQLVGYSGKTGRATGPHLHWGMKWTTERVDPMSLTGPMR